MPSETANIKVITRTRPLNLEEESRKVQSIVSIDGDSTSIQSGGRNHMYTFSGAFPCNATNVEVFQSKVDPFIKRALDGYNVTIICFGATGSGKSYLMEGSTADPGIAIQVNSAIFKQLSEKAKKDIFVTASFVDIIDEKMIDLLNPHCQEMQIRQHPYKSIYVDGLSEIVVHSVDEINLLYEQGMKVREAGATDLQAHRQRSNGVFTITIEQKEKKSNKLSLRSTITLCDLAGLQEDTGDGIKTYSGCEALLNVLKCFSDSKLKGGHVPYRDSNVTRLLQEALGGNSFTLFISLLSPTELHRSQTLATLKYSQMAQSIKNKVKLNIDESGNAITELRNEINKVREKITSSDYSKSDVLKMEELVKDLEIAKKQSWQEREKLSDKMQRERKTNLINMGLYEWVINSAANSRREIKEKLVYLHKEKNQLSRKYREAQDGIEALKDTLQKMITDYTQFTDSGKLNESETKKRVTAIHETKEKLKVESEALKSLKQRLKNANDKFQAETGDAQAELSGLKGNSDLREKIEIEELRRMEEANKLSVLEEKNRLKAKDEIQISTIQRRADDGKGYSLQEGAKFDIDCVKLKSEVSIMHLQMQGLGQEKEYLLQSLETLYKLHRDESEIQQLQNFQLFRQYRETHEEQRNAIDQRYRQLLQDSIQDAIYLSTRNRQLSQENCDLKQHVAELKDTVTRLEGGLKHK